MPDVWSTVLVAAEILAALVTIGTPVYLLVRSSIKRWLNDAIAPYLSSGDKSVANYAHDASMAAHAAQDAAMAAQDAALAAKEAAIEVRDMVLKIDGRTRRAEQRRALAFRPTSDHEPGSPA